jgi:uncharacterized membrane protein YjjP (DUF1212 family)
MERDFVDIYLQVGRLLFQSGATVQRIIDSIGQVKKYLGGDDIHVMIEYDGIIITDINNRKFHTRVETRRAFGGTNIAVLVAVSRLVRNIDRDRPSEAEIKEQLEKIANIEADVQGWLQHLTFGVVAVCFGVLNGADIFASAAIFPAGVILSAVKVRLLARNHNLFFATLIASLAGIGLSGLIAMHTPTTAALVAIIAVVLPLVPGFPMINAGVDILRNHNAVGLGRLAFAFMMIGILTMAVSVPLLFFSTLQHDPQTALNPWQVQVIGVLSAAIGAAGLGLMFNVPYRYLGMIAIGALLARFTRTLMMDYGTDMVSATFCGAVCASVVASMAAQRYHLPAAVFALISVLPMIPGFLAINGLNNLYILSRLPSDSITTGFLAVTAQTLLKAGFIIGALLTGVIFPVFLIDGRSLRI